MHSRKSHGTTHAVQLALVGALTLTALVAFFSPGRAVADPKFTIIGISAADDAGYPVDKDGKAIDAGQIDKTAIPAIRLNERLVLFLDGVGSDGIDPNKVVLSLNDRPIRGLKDTIYLSNQHALVFHLVRTGDNADDWGNLLGSPGADPRRLEVGFWSDAAQLKTNPPASPPPPLAGANGVQPQFDLVLISAGWLLGAIVAVAVVLAAVWAAATRTNLLRDSLLPQLPQNEQPYSLGRTQMAFWFTLIFSAFVFLFVLLHDFNTLTSQSLTLMGLSGATAVFAVAIDASKDTPVGDANDTLRGIGLATYQDVVKLRQDLCDLNKSLTAGGLSADGELAIRTKIADLFAKQRTYQDLAPQFRSTGWYRDLTTDINGPALHRVQVFYWTLALGFVFLFEVYQTLTMPKFSDTLLAVMGVTSAGYLGFKYPEKQN